MGQNKIQGLEPSGQSHQMSIALTLGATIGLIRLILLLYGVIRSRSIQPQRRHRHQPLVGIADAGRRHPDEPGRLSLNAKAGTPAQRGGQSLAARHQ